MASGLQCRTQHGRSWVQSLNLHQCLWTHLQICGSKCLDCYADLYAVSRCHTRGESQDHTSEKVYKESTLALKPRANITRSPKQGYQWPHEKDLCPPKIFKTNFSLKELILGNILIYGIKTELMRSSQH